MPRLAASRGPFVVIRQLVVVVLVAMALMLVGPTGTLIDVRPAAAQETDQDVPPGNPVIGDDRPGDIEPEDDTRYGLWALLAVCLIAAGFLLVRIERWERKRSPRSDED